MGVAIIGTGDADLPGVDRHYSLDGRRQGAGEAGTKRNPAGGCAQQRAGSTCTGEEDGEAPQMTWLGSENPVGWVTDRWMAR